MNIDYSMSLLSLHVVDQQDSLTNVAKRVSWQITFFDESDPDISTLGSVLTYLDTDSIPADEFIPYDDLTHTTILGWALEAEGGAAFLEMLKERHAPTLLMKKLDASLTERSLQTMPEA